MPTPTLELFPSLALVGVIALVNILLRFLPGWIFGGKRKTPRFLLMLGRVLPHAVMGMLIIYCLRGISVVHYPYGLPEIIACVVTAALHFWKQNSLLSIGCGVLSYMLLVQLVF
ncbi:MAG: AzlD domain-containing protein [Clostridia bacterium]|nr:AzlD domain-containing protein [Clostridia bacterium]